MLEIQAVRAGSAALISRNSSCPGGILLAGFPLKHMSKNEMGHRLPLSLWGTYFWHVQNFYLYKKFYAYNLFIRKNLFDTYKMFTRIIILRVQKICPWDPPPGQNNRLRNWAIYIYIYRYLWSLRWCWGRNCFSSLIDQEPLWWAQWV